ncbi:MAG TPA: hypothetical protein VHA78_05560 [Candidatus Peribacteraceae bacterium]|nr:hypothetical protein [Candidatus Peribacteraceae bacterium]
MAQTRHDQLGEALRTLFSIRGYHKLSREDADHLDLHHLVGNTVDQLMEHFTPLAREHKRKVLENIVTLVDLIQSAPVPQPALVEA